MIIGISGKINSGKDTVGNIIQILIDSPHFSNEAVIKFLDIPAKYSYINMKFADSLKDMVCILLNCTREQLEDREFKEKELGEEWWYYQDKNEGIIYNYFTNKEKETSKYFSLIKPTPRLLLQLLGTECGRNILHPNVWVNSLMSKYKPKEATLISKDCPRQDIYSVTEEDELIYGTVGELYPDWIITDLRFPNELKAIKDRGGISIRVNRPKESLYMYNGDKYNLKDLFTEVHKDTGEYPLKVYADDHWLIKEPEHESETALDNAKFDVIIDNNGTLNDLVDKCRDVIKEFKLK